eukprot:TRINITY_DN25451_c0_g1_i2.p1 TRINITY_DN25451_c0_g1~~TRINITY_DN25451_c0_g1_i2.p1  ORF type:complete len:152 (+),score=29.18 TRINITY_DN25451_c0_g1_i2:55-510(+)
MTGSLRGIQKTASVCVHHKPRPKEEKSRIFQMCMNKMKCLNDSILYKHVLIKNTLKEIQKTNICDTEEYTANKDDLTFGAIEELLKEIDLATKTSEKHSLGDRSVKREVLSTHIRNDQNTDIMEDFHSNEAIGQTKIILDEDPSVLFDSRF